MRYFLVLPLLITVVIAQATTYTFLGTEDSSFKNKLNWENQMRPPLPNISAVDTVFIESQIFCKIDTLLFVQGLIVNKGILEASDISIDYNGGTFENATGATFYNYIFFTFRDSAIFYNDLGAVVHNFHTIRRIRHSSIINHGTWYTEAGGRTNDGQLSRKFINSGAVVTKGDGHFTNSDSLLNTGMILNEADAMFEVFSYFDNQDTLHNAPDAHCRFSGQQIFNNGKIIQAADSLIITGTTTNNGLVHILDNASIILGPGSLTGNLVNNDTLCIDENAVFVFEFNFENPTEGVLINKGSFQQDAQSTFGTVRNYGLWDQQGQFTSVGFFVNEGTLTGDGCLQAQSVSLLNGCVKPGNSIGKLEISTPNSIEVRNYVCDIHPNGQSDTIDGGTATTTRFGGFLRIHLLEHDLNAACGEYTIIHYANLSSNAFNRFDTVEFPDLDTEVKWELDYQSDRLVLRYQIFENNALAFDGIDDVVRIDGFQSVEAHTIEFLYFPFILPQTKPIITVDNLGSGIFGRLSNSANLTLVNNGLSITTDYPFETIKWHHVAIVSDGNVYDKIYVNGILAESYTNGSGPANPQVFALTSVEVGNTFHGRLDDIRFWSKSRTAAEINSDYLKTLNGDEEGLIAYYPMQSGNPTGDNQNCRLDTMFDKANNYHGILQNFSLIAGASNWVFPCTMQDNVFLNQNIQWNNSSNWSLGIVPQVCHNVLIPEGPTVLIDFRPANCHSIEIGPNVSLELMNGQTLDVYGTGNK